MITDDDIDTGGDGENRSLPARLYQSVKSKPLFLGAGIGVVFIIAILMIFAGSGHAPMVMPDPTTITVSAEQPGEAEADKPVGLESDTPESTTSTEHAKPATLSEDSAPSTAIPVVAELALVITDVGLSRRVNEAVVRQLPTATTITVSPYATNVAATMSAYKSAGNDVWLQLATRSTQAGIDPGPLAMSAALPVTENQNYLNQQLANGGNGFVGLYVPDDADITMNIDAWKTMALDQIGKNLMIMDGTTAKVATELYVPQDDSHISAYLKADIIVPGDKGPSALKRGLADAVPVILREREAIVVINHPTAIAVTQVAEWLKTLRNQGILLVPASKFTGLKP